MLWTIVILVILWLLGFAFHVAGGRVHILLVIALIVAQQIGSVCWRESNFVPFWTANNAS